MRPISPTGPLSLVPEGDTHDPVLEPMVVNVVAVPTDTATTAQYVANEHATNPRLCRIVAIGSAISGKRAVCHLALTPADEKIALSEFWRRVDAVGGHVVTWDGNWDLHVLLLRSVALRVMPTLDARHVADWFVRYRYAPHFDVKAVLLNWDNTRTSGEGLDEWAKFLGIANVKSSDGSQVCRMVQQGRWDELASYNRQDVGMIDAAYRKVRDFYPSIFDGSFG